MTRETRTGSVESGGFGGSVIVIMALKRWCGRWDRREISVSGSRGVVDMVGGVAWDVE